MPLDGQHKLSARQLQRFNNPFRCRCRHVQARCQQRNCLVMPGVDLISARSEDRCEQTFWSNPDRMCVSDTGRAMILNVLGKSSTAKNVEELHAPTDGQNGKVTCEGIAQQSCLSLITFHIRLVGLPQRGLPV